MYRRLIFAIFLLTNIITYSASARLYNCTKSVLKVKLNISNAIDQEFTLAAGESKVIDVGNYLTNWVHSCSITAMIANNDEDGSVQEIQIAEIKHDKLGDFEYSVFYTKDTNTSSKPKTEKLTFWGVKQVPEKSAEFLRPKQTLSRASRQH
jgi:hypothetical protein